MTFVVTNPLHYVYYPRVSSTRSIAAAGSLADEYGSALGFTQLKILNALNTVKSLIEADTESEGPYISWRSAETAKPMLGNQVALASRIESKATIRTIIDDRYFARFVELDPIDFSRRSFDELATMVNSARIVIQQDNSTGGKGTFFVHDGDSLAAVHEALRDNTQQIVVSAFVSGENRAIQCLRLRGKTFVQNWWHRDLVSVEGIYNPDVPSATRYCGAILENLPKHRIGEVYELARMVGDKIGNMGYEGVFGIDLVEPLTAEEPMILIEVNARLTAVSHLYATAMHRCGYQTDYVTLSLNSLTSAPVDLSELDEQRDLPSSYYYFKLQNLDTVSRSLSAEAKLGVYDAENLYQRFGWGINDLSEQTEFIVIPEVAHDISREPGQRTFSIIGSGDPMHNGRLSPDYRKRIAALNAVMLQ